MSVFLIIIFIALLGVTIWQLSKIYNLSKPTSGSSSSQVATDKDNRRQGKYFFWFMIAFYIFMIYCFWNYTEFYPPKAASAHGSAYDNLMLISMIIIVFVQFLTQGLLFWYSYKYQGKKGRKALFQADNDKLEFIWTIIPVITLAGLIIYGLFTWSEIMNIEETEETLVIELYAKQFSWTARYSGQDGVLGKANVRLIEGRNVLGVDMSDPYAQDDKIVKVLHLPVGRPVLFKMRSQDVLHSAYMPFFRAQMNVVPGMITQFGFTPTVTTEEIRKTDEIIADVKEVNKIIDQKNKARAVQGKVALDDYKFDYFMLCNKICGVSHYNMRMKIVVESKEEYQEWIAKQKTLGQTLGPKTKSNSTEESADTFQKPSTGKVKISKDEQTDSAKKAGDDKKAATNNTQKK